MGFGLVIGFIGLFDTAHDYTFSFLLHISCLVTASNGGIFPSSGWSCPRASATSFSQQQQQSSNYFTNQLSLTDSTNSPTDWLLTNFSCLLHLNTDRTENTVSLLLCHFCIRVCLGSHVITIQSLTCNGRWLQCHYLQLLLYSHLFRDRCLATGLHTTILLFSWREFVKRISISHGHNMIIWGKEVVFENEQPNNKRKIETAKYLCIGKRLFITIRDTVSSQNTDTCCCHFLIWRQILDDAQEQRARRTECPMLCSFVSVFFHAY
jgi:hypothetical protein